MYVALFPCNECAKLIIQSGIREVVYLGDKYHDRRVFVFSLIYVYIFTVFCGISVACIASRRLLDMAGVSD